MGCSEKVQLSNTKKDVSFKISVVRKIEKKLQDYKVM